jgi:DNA-binding NtrC family response regulator
MAKILIIDDEAPILDLMTQLCKGMGHEVMAFQTGKEGVAALKQESPDLAIVDLRIPALDGLALVEKCADEHPEMPIVMVTGFGTVETAVEAMKLGAFDYMTKPFELDDLQRTINRGLKHAGKGSPATLVVETDPIRPTNSIIGDSPEMRGILQMVAKIADNDSPTLLEGEFGSGKQMVARTIHDRSRRKDEPFKVLACSALPEDLLEAELFGGDGRTSTIFNRAHGGTVVLEEINMLPTRLQSQLDSFLEDVNTRRMQGSLPENLDFRFIATSTEPLEKWVQDGKFREDLYYRISVIPFQIPPLRARKDDIPLLADHFLDNYSKLTGSKKKEIDKYAMKLLVSYGWPGNVGELQNAIERACAFADDDRVRPIDLPPKVSQKIEISDEENQALKHQLPIGTKLSDYIKKQEKMFIRETLKYNEGSREKTASMLGVSIATLYRKMGLKLERDKMLSS